MWQGILFGCFLTLLGILTIPNLFASKKEELTVFFKKIILCQGWLGLIACIIGVIGVIQCSMEIVMDIKPILWLTDMLCFAALAFLGFLLSYNLIFNYFLSKGKGKEQNTYKTLSNIMPMQGKIGMLGILIGIWSIMAAVMFA